MASRLPVNGKKGHEGKNRDKAAGRFCPICPYFVPTNYKFLLISNYWELVYQTEEEGEHNEV